MRTFIDLCEVEDDRIRKRNTDDRDIVAKLRDLIDHPNTEPHLRDVAQRKLDRILGAEAAAQASAEERAEIEAKLPMIGLIVTFNRVPGKDKTLPVEQWDELFERGKGKSVRFRQIIEALLPLRPFRIDFTNEQQGFVGSHIQVWFHPEDNPDHGSEITAALKAKKVPWIESCDEATYFRGGQAKYFLGASKFRDSWKAARKK